MNRRFSAAVLLAGIFGLPLQASAQHSHDSLDDGDGHPHSHDMVSDKPWDVYGSIYLSVDYNDPGATGQSNLYLDSDGTMLGFRGSVPLNYNMTGIWQIESVVDLTELGSENESEIAGQNSFLGLQGSYGRLLGGKHDTPYKNATHHLDIFHHLPGDYRIMLGKIHNLNSGAGGHHGGAFHIRAPDILLYKTPRLGGWTAEVAAFAFDENTTPDVDGDPSAYAFNVVYEAGMFYGTLAYELHNNYDTYGDAHDEATLITVDKTEAATLGLMVHYGPAMLSFIAEHIEVTDADTVNVPNKSRDAYYLAAQTGVYNTKLKFAYGVAQEFETDDGGQFIAAGISHNLSKTTEAYFVYTGVDNEVNGAYGTLKIDAFRTGADPSTFSIGMIHDF